MQQLVMKLHWEKEWRRKRKNEGRLGKWLIMIPRRKRSQMRREQEVLVILLREKRRTIILINGRKGLREDN